MNFELYSYSWQLCYMIDISSVMSVPANIFFGSACKNEKIRI